MTEVPALSFEGLEVRMGGRPVLRAVDLALAPGEVLGLAGRNGAGKTTLLRAAARVVRPHAGSVSIRGRAVATLSRRELAREVAMVAQDSGVSFPFRAGEVVLMGRTPHLGALGFESAEDVERARAAMERVGILDLADRPVPELSGGERQLVMVARALVQDARILLLDEPTAHLDLRHRIEVQDIVREFVGAGGSALVVSHDLNLAARSCDRIALLADGRVLAAGAPSDVLRRDTLRTAFDVQAEVSLAADGMPLVAPRAPGRANAPAD